VINLAINIADLTVGQEGEKKVREYIQTPTGKIEIYEPTVDMIDKIMNIQRGGGVDLASSETVEFDAMLVLKELFPLLTNIETGNLPDEELNKIIDNPSVHLLTAQNIVAQILSEVNKLYVEDVKAKIASSESALAQAEMIATIPTLMIENAKRNGNQALVRKIDEAEKELDRAIESAQSGEDIDIPEIVERAINAESKLTEDKEIPVAVGALKGADSYTESSNVEEDKGEV
jgi:hypothetical protein